MIVRVSGSRERFLERLLGNTEDATLDKGNIEVTSGKDSSSGIVSNSNLDSIELETGKSNLELGNSSETLLSSIVGTESNSYKSESTIVDGGKKELESGNNILEYDDTESEDEDFDDLMFGSWGEEEVAPEDMVADSVEVQENDGVVETDPMSVLDGEDDEVDDEVDDVFGGEEVSTLESEGNADSESEEYDEDDIFAGTDFDLDEDSEESTEEERVEDSSGNEGQFEMDDLGDSEFDGFFDDQGEGDSTENYSSELGEDDLDLSDFFGEEEYSESKDNSVRVPSGKDESGKHLSINTGSSRGSENLFDIDSMEDASDEFIEMMDASSRMDELCEKNSDPRPEIEEMVSVPKPAKVEEDRKEVKVEEKKEVGYDRDSYKDVRDFVKKNRNCSVSEVLKVFSKEEVEKALNLGRISKRSNKLFI